MAQKKLQLSKIKVKSLVTLVDKNEQRTSKGGYRHNYMKKHFSDIIQIAQEVGWTEYKTRLTDSDPGDNLLSSNRGSRIL